MPTATRLFPPDIDQCIAAVEREIAMRRRVYPRFVEQQKMSPNKARYEIEAMEEVLAVLKRVREGA